MSQQEYKGYKIKDGYVVQTKYFKIDSWNEYSEAEKWAKTNNSERLDWDQYLQYKINSFCSNVEVLEVVPISMIGSTLHDGTFSKTSTTYSKRPEFLVVFQIEKSKLTEVTQE